MPPRDLDLSGPSRATLQDIEGLNRLFSEAFTDRYHRDGLTGVRIPHLHPDVWRYALEDTGAGAMIWRGPDGELVAFNMVHRSGCEGWMGPLAVRPTLQGRGIGRRIVIAGIEWLRAHGATRVGLETMPRTVENIGFYAALGFRPGHLTLTMTGVPDRDDPGPGIRELSGAGQGAADLVAACHDLVQRLDPGVDYTRELLLTEELGLGDTTVWLDGDRCRAFALWHSVPLAAGRSEEVRVLKLVAEDRDAFTAIVGAVGRGARAPVGESRVSVRCQTAYAEAYQLLLDAGYRIHWTDLRMLSVGDPERPPVGIIFSNWEI